MKPVIRSVSAVLAVSALFLSPVAGSLPVFGDDAVHAKDKGGGNDKDGGKDKDKDKGERGGGKDKADRGSGKHKGGDEARDAGNGNGNGWGRKDKEKAKDKPAAQTAAAEDGVKPLGQGALASGLKGANAANASEEAFANAAPHSQVGRVATYRAAVRAEAAEAALPALVEERDALLDIDAATRTDDEAARLAELEAEIAGLSEQAAYDGPSSEEALLEATNGRELSYEEKAYLHDLLGLEPPADPAPEGEAAEGPAEPVETVEDDLPSDTDEDLAEDGEIVDEGDDLAEVAGDDSTG